MYSIRVSKKPRLVEGFRTAATALAESTMPSSSSSSSSSSTEVGCVLHNNSTAAITSMSRTDNKDDSCDSENEFIITDEERFQVTTQLSLVGWPHYSHLHNDKKPDIGQLIELVREPSNEHDENAIAVLDADSKKKFGYISAVEAAVMSPLLNDGMISFDKVSISKIFSASFQLSVELTVLSEDVVCSYFADTTDSSTVCSKTPVFSTKPALRDIEQAAKAPYKLCQLQQLLWDPEGSTNKPPSLKPQLLFAFPQPYDATKVCALSKEEMQRAAMSSWPPEDKILIQLGMAPSTDSKWWLETAGLLPPSEWDVVGAYDVTSSKSDTISSTQRKLAGETLAGAIHGVTNAWHNATLCEVSLLLREPNFWCQRNGDALIRAFGGPYVLGQQPEDLVLVRSAPHTTLTSKMCLAHNIVYTLVHLEPPAAPGFNTLIFGANMRGAGFHYHQDAISEMRAKNSSLMPCQPVVTSILYEQPEQDSGKEVVLWKPVLNWPSSRSDLYSAARAVQTVHGTIHVQSAGLQSKAQHGVFHTPSDSEQRQGYRVAITARISKRNANAIVDNFAARASYREQIGPDGDVTMP